MTDSGKMILKTMTLTLEENANRMANSRRMTLNKMTPRNTTLSHIRMTHSHKMT